MAISAGIFNTVGFGRETVYGTKVTPTMFIPLKPSDGIDENMDKQFVEAIKGTAPKNKASFIGQVELAGGFESDLYPNYIGMILRSALGDYSVATEYGESAVYRHTYTETEDKPSYTVEKKAGDLIKTYAGYIVKMFSIEASAGDVVNFNFEGFAKSQENTTPATTPVYEAKDPFNFVHITSITIGGVEYGAKVEEMSVEYDNALESAYALGDNYLKGNYPGQSEAKGSFTMFLDSASKDLIDDNINNTEQEIVITIQGGPTIGNASKDSVIVTIPRATLTSTATPLDFDYNKVELEFEGIEHATSGLIQVELINEIAAYNA